MMLFETTALTQLPQLLLTKVNFLSASTCSSANSHTTTTQQPPEQPSSSFSLFTITRTNNNKNKQQSKKKKKEEKERLDFYSYFDGPEVRRKAAGDGGP